MRRGRWRRGRARRRNESANSRAPRGSPWRGYASCAVQPAVERALGEADELELVTIGRVTGAPHSVRLRFAYDRGIIWLRTGERPSAPDASGVRRRTESERTTDWL